jgi:hypothetical protein
MAIRTAHTDLVNGIMMVKITVLFHHDGCDFLIRTINAIQHRTESDNQILIYIAVCTSYLEIDYRFSPNGFH